MTDRDDEYQTSAATRARPRRTRRPSSTSASSTRARRRSRSRSSTRPGILQVSPSNTYVGLTRSEGADKGEPDKYYPSGKRTYGRVVPADHIQAAAQVTYQKDQGCTKTYILNDKEVYGKGIADQVAERSPRRRASQIAGNDGIDTKAANFRSLAHEDQVLRRGLHVLRRHHPEQGRPGVQGRQRRQPEHQAVRPGRRRRVGRSTTKLGSAVAEARPTSPNPTLDPKLYPPAAQDFFAKFKAKYGKDPEPYAIYGYEAMSVALRRSRTPATRATTARPSSTRSSRSRTATRCSASTRSTRTATRRCPTTARDRVEGGKLVFDKVIKAQTQG